MATLAAPGNSSAYDLLAPFYDALEGDRTRQVEYVRSLIDEHAFSASSLLELGCGTGAVLSRLHARYEVTGVDNSPAMLEAAARALPRARLLQADMTRVHVGETFDVVLCVYDTINHFRQFSEWEAVFDRAVDHLNPDGIFIVDMNTARSLEDLVARSPIVRWFGTGDLVVLDIRLVGDDDFPPRVLTRWTVSLFENIGGNSYQLHALTLDEVAFENRRIEESLQQRFKKVWAYDPERQAPSIETRRLHFVCRN